MFDPHKTRYNNRRKYQKRGQIIQARKVEIPRTIEQNLIPLYQEYFKKNYITGYIPDQPPQPSINTLPPFYIISSDTVIQSSPETYPLNHLGQILVIRDTDSYIFIYFVDNRSNDVINILTYDGYILPPTDNAKFVNEEGQELFSLRSYPINSSGDFSTSYIEIPKTEGLILNEISN